MSKSLTISPVRISSEPMRDHSQEWAWIAEHGEAYRGQWVMVRHDQLVAADPNIRALLSKVPREIASDSIVWYLKTEEEEKMIIL